MVIKAMPKFTHEFNKYLIMSKYRKLTHVFYKCDYHIVFTPKYRYKVLDGIRKPLLEHGIQQLCSWKEVEVHELNVQVDHIHIVFSIPPKLSVSEFMGFLKGKLAMKLFKTYPSLKQKLYWGNHSWSRGYFISTVGLDEEMIRRYVKYQDKNG